MDTKTLLIALLVATLTTNLCIVILYWTRRTYPGFGLWVLGSFSRTVGILLFMLPRDLFPSWLTIILANYLLLAGLLLNNRGVLIFRDRYISYGWEIAVSLSFCALFAYFTYVDPNVAARVDVFGFYIGGVEIWTVVILMIQRPVYFGSSDRLQAVALGILATFYLVRSGYTLTLESPLANHLAALPWAGINILTGVITTILITLSQVMMNAQRVEYDYRIAEERLQQDIIERKQAEEQLRIALRRLDTVVSNLHTGILLVSKDGCVELANQMFCDLFDLAETPDRLRGWTSGEMLQKIQKVYASPADALARIQDIVAQGQLIKSEEMAVQGGRFYLREFIPIFMEGHLAGRLWQHMDITERKRMEAALRQSEAQFRSYFELPLAGRAITSPSAGWIDVNATLCEMLGYAKAELLQMTWTELTHPDDLAADSAQFQRVMAGEIEGYALEKRFIHRDGHSVYTHLAVHCLRRPDRSVDYFVAQILDITERKQTEETLVESKKLYQAITDTSPLAIYMSSGIDERAEYINPTFIRLFGYTLDEVPTAAKWWPLAYPDVEYRNWVAEEWQRRIERAIETHSAIENMEVVVTCKDGSKKNISWGFVSVGDKNWSFGLDFTDRKHMEEALRLSLAEAQRHDFQMIALNRMDDLLLACETRQEAHAIIAQSASVLFDGYAGGLAVKAETALDLHLVAGWGEDHGLLPQFSLPDCWALRRGEPYQVTDPAHDILCQHFATPPEYPYLCLPLTVRGEILGLLHVSTRGPLFEERFFEGRNLVIKVSESIKLALSNLHLREALREQTIRDPLTGLFNRRYLDETLPRELHRCQRNGEPLAVAMLDIDHFKHFNDAYGHDAGDSVLRAIGDLFKRSLRAGDIACRYGGEELTVILPGSTLDDARIRLDSLRCAIMQLRVIYKDDGLPTVTVSIGVAAAEEQEVDGATLLGRADAALYLAKEQGRNRVIVSEA